MIDRLLLTLPLLFAAAPAAAQDYATKTVGDWTVAASRDGDGCFATRTFDRDGATTLLLGLSADGSNRLTLLNANWSIKPRDRLTLDYRLSNRRFAKQFAVGMAADRKQGFVSTFDAKFPAQFAASTSLAVFRGDVPVERVTLEGSGVAVAELRRCVTASKGAPRGARAADSDAIPKDPFAEPAKRRRK
ncbi:hypothetical protein [Sphingomonas sp. Y38-1Y]|uniref:hypothetical protein n=1 Tax=Sphingomonas sp. Y38-1Y TaxID=3078265 RepID=UPI0028EB0BF0|nr:hypothetical protein [Sphingomonas sp. Y38-1Y]